MVRDTEQGSRPTFRERHRAARRREFLDVARNLLMTEGEDAVTMQRITSEVGSSVGGIYIYFSSRDALLTELQHDAFQTVLGSFRAGGQALDDYLAAEKVDPAEAALAAVLASCVFWVECETTMPAEIELSRRLIAGGTETKLEGEPGVLPLAMEILNQGLQRLEAATSTGVLAEGNNVERAVSLIAAMTGFLMVSRLGEWDAALFDARRLATAFAANNLRGWGASPEHLAAAEAHLDGFRQTGDLAPVVPAAS